MYLHDVSNFLRGFYEEKQNGRQKTGKGLKRNMRSFKAPYGKISINIAATFSEWLSLPCFPTLLISGKAEICGGVAYIDV